MKLLFDQNISFKIKNALAEEFPESIHVSDIRMQTSTDAQVWEYAKSNSLTIVSKDSDYFDLSMLLGSPPKVIWVNVGNSSTLNLINILKSNTHKIKEFIESTDSTCLKLGA
jgi:predicted nuclease of predicted toxin-antitoxin system